MFLLLLVTGPGSAQAQYWTSSGCTGDTVPSQQMMPETAVLEQVMDSFMEWGLVTVRLNSVIQQRLFLH